MKAPKKPILICCKCIVVSGPAVYYEWLHSGKGEVIQFAVKLDYYIDL